GTTLTVTQNVSGINLQGSSYLSGAGIVKGTGSSSGTYIDSSSGDTGIAGTYNVSPAQSVANTLITAQRTNMYKFSLIDPIGNAGNVYYVDNVGFTAE
ncbi:MAG: hypothetical protein ACLPTF_11845, partial [Steroidobacteraceae bacterium]